MERLTKRVGLNEAVSVCDFDICAPFVKSGLCKTGSQGFPFSRWERHCNDTCILGRTIDRLADYEDTGLEPEEIVVLQKQKEPGIIMANLDLSDAEVAEFRKQMRETAVIMPMPEPSIEFIQQGWIPVTERLPENEKPFQEYLVTICRDHFPTSSYDVCDAPYSEEYTTTACFDSRNKLWHVCREEVVLNALIMPEDSPVNGECVTAWADMPIPYR